MKKIIARYSKARLESCGQRKSKYFRSHKKGCYLRLMDKDVDYSDDSLFIVVDFDKNNKIVGIEFVDGLK